jgi:Domain of unknown function (DUF4384)
MRLRIILCAVLIALGGLVFAQEPQDEENVRGAFLTSRPKEKPPAPAANTRPIRHPPKQTSIAVSAGVKSSNSNSAVTGDTSASTISGPKGTTSKMGMGLTLFSRDSNGLAVRVDPAREFHKGDAVRILLETNTDGYLYIFNTTDGGPPVMIYPSQELDEGGNYIRSHEPIEIPSSLATDERLRWFRFDQYAGTERLYFVFTREPLTGVPIEGNLISYCHEKRGPCPWRPSAEVWTLLQREMNAPLKTSRAQKYGRAQTSSEQVAATTRGIGLSQEDPEPSVITMSASVGGNTLVTALDLVHK